MDVLEWSTAVRMHAAAASQDAEPPGRCAHGPEFVRRFKLEFDSHSLVFNAQAYDTPPPPRHSWHVERAPPPRQRKHSGVTERLMMMRAIGNWKDIVRKNAISAEQVRQTVRTLRYPSPAERLVVKHEDARAYLCGTSQFAARTKAEFFQPQRVRRPRSAPLPRAVAKHVPPPVQQLKLPQKVLRALEARKRKLQQQVQKGRLAKIGHNSRFASVRALAQLAGKGQPKDKRGTPPVEQQLPVSKSLQCLPPLDAEGPSAPAGQAQPKPVFGFVKLGMPRDPSVQSLASDTSEPSPRATKRGLGAVLQGTRARLKGPAKDTLPVGQPTGMDLRSRGSFIVTGLAGQQAAGLKRGSMRLRPKLQTAGLSILSRRQCTREAGNAGSGSPRGLRRASRNADASVFSDFNLNELFQSKFRNVRITKLPEFRRVASYHAIQTYRKTAYGPSVSLGALSRLDTWMSGYSPMRELREWMEEQERRREEILCMFREVGGVASCPAGPRAEASTTKKGLARHKTRSKLVDATPVSRDAVQQQKLGSAETVARRIVAEDEELAWEGLSIRLARLKAALSVLGKKNAGTWKEMEREWAEARAQAKIKRAQYLSGRMPRLGQTPQPIASLQNNRVRTEREALALKSFALRSVPSTPSAATPRLGVFEESSNGDEEDSARSRATSFTSRQSRSPRRRGTGTGSSRPRFSTSASLFGERRIDAAPHTESRSRRPSGASEFALLPLSFMDDIGPQATAPMEAFQHDATTAKRKQMSGLILDCLSWPQRGRTSHSASSISQTPTFSAVAAADVNSPVIILTPAWEADSNRPRVGAVDFDVVDPVVARSTAVTCLAAATAGCMAARLCEIPECLQSIWGLVAEPCDKTPLKWISEWAPSSVFAGHGRATGHAALKAHLANTARPDDRAAEKHEAEPAQEQERADEDSPSEPAADPGFFADLDSIIERLESVRPPSTDCDLLFSDRMQEEHSPEAEPSAGSDAGTTCDAVEIVSSPSAPRRRPAARRLPEPAIASVRRMRLNERHIKTLWARKAQAKRDTRTQQSTGFALAACQTLDVLPTMLRRALSLPPQPTDALQSQEAQTLDRTLRPTPPPQRPRCSAAPRRPPRVPPASKVPTALPVPTTAST
eukprot:TRINITY_DN17158_c0_g1_i2.p1 TRINITY_DN17158_c0_g1~~TRINITY_DN17158_c0_g1_i2.p1  ORF type:complete len:1153 (+),score=212.48 TRINITY_DN17158_c0_g1_i2:75-3461(+)